MGIIAFYLLALIPVFIGAAMMLFDKRVVWWEWVVGSLSGFIVAGIMHAVAVCGMTSDIETWSGQVARGVHYPEWVEEYQQAHTRQVCTGTDSKGNPTYSTEIYYTTEYRTHRKYWTTETTIGEFEISQAKFNELVGKFKSKIETKHAHKSGFYSGDHNIYIAHNQTGWLEPVTDLRSWSNRVKAAPSAFTFKIVPPTIPVYDWPENPDRFVSDRLLGVTGLSSLEFDQMNARLGARKHVNVIIVGFGMLGSEMAEWQRAKWLGGKKNDLVLCFGGNPAHPTWTKVFGWTESDVCKYSLQDVMLNKGVSSATLPEIEKIIQTQFHAKDWSKFDYLRIEPRPKHFFILLGLMVLSQAAWWYFACSNDYEKDGTMFGTAYRFYRRGY